MEIELEQALRPLLPGFEIEGVLRQVHLLRRGHIHDTCVSEWFDSSSEKMRFVHQRLNQHVFSNIPQLMENISKVTTHLREKVRARAQKHSSRQEKVLTLVASREGAWCLLDQAGNYWRTYKFIENSESFDVCPSVAHAREAARAFGQFIQDMADFPIDSLYDSIPSFQDGGVRVRRLIDAVEQDRAGRVALAQTEIEFARRNAQTASLLSEALCSGSLPLRVTHADPKINNVLFDKSSGQVIAVVDLDTCMRGTALYDFGDMLRSGVLQVAEDEPEVARVKINSEFLKAQAQGFLEGCGNLLQPSEKSLMPKAPQVVSLGLGIRFLTDFLEGDLYFKVTDPQQNLRRARVQFALAREFEKFKDALFF